MNAAQLPRHELNGLQVRVVDSSDPSKVGIAGRVVVETTETLHVEDRADSPRVRVVPKRESTFEFTLADPTDWPVATTAEAAETVTVEGERLAARPARRTERSGESRWR